MLVDSDHHGSWRLYESGPHLSACGVRGGFVAAWDAIADAQGMDAYAALDDPCTLASFDLEVLKASSGNETSRSKNFAYFLK